MNLKVLVINLKSSSERRDRISKQLESLDIPYEFLEATEGRTLTDEWIENNIGDKLKDIYYNNLHYSVNKNALACADSHRRAQVIASEFKGGYTLILEDDVQIAKGFKKKIFKTINLMRKHSLHVAFPGYNLAKGSVEKWLDIDYSGSGFFFFKYPIDGHVSGAYSYLVDAIAAKELVDENLEKIQSTADTFYLKEKGLSESTVLLYPKIVTTGYFESDIGYLNPEVTLMQKVKQIIYSLSLKSNTLHSFLRYKKERTM